MSTQLVAAVGSLGERPQSETLLVCGELERAVTELATRLERRFERLSVSAASDLSVTLDAVGPGSVDVAVVTTDRTTVVTRDPVRRLFERDDVVAALVAASTGRHDPPESVTPLERRGNWLIRLEAWLRLQLDGVPAPTHDETVDAREQYERLLERQNERLAEFTGVISHDLRNPLGVIVDRARLARETGDTEHIDAIVETAEEMEAFLDDLLALARQGNVVGDPEPVSLETAARRAWSRIETPDSRLVFDGPETVVADGSRLDQLLENLFANAVDHGAPTARSGASVDHGSAGAEAGTLTRGSGSDDDGWGGEWIPAHAAGEDDVRGVTVTVGPLPTGFYVADDGPGIPEDERASVFEHGYTTSEDGTGFGLAIVESVASAHGWEVDLAPPEEYCGACFEITGVDLPGLDDGG